MSARSDRVLVWAIVGSHFAPPFMFSGVAVALPTLGHELAAGATELALVETMFLGGSMAFLLPAGRLADAADKRTLFKLGFLAFGGLSIAIGLCSSLPLILLLRCLQGAASAVFAATAPALLAELVPLQRRGTVYGASMGVVYAGLTLGPLAAGGLVALWSWRAVFLCGGAVILLAVVLVAPRLPSQWRSPGRAVHVPSAALMVTAVFAATFGAAQLQHGWLGIGLLGAAALLGAAFVAVQLRTDRPLVDLRALAANATLSSALAVQLLLYLNAFCSMFMLSLFLQVTLHEPPTMAGRVLAAGSVVMAVVAPIAGLLSDRLRPGLVTASGAATVLLSSWLGCTLSNESGAMLAGGVLALQGVGFGLFSSPNMAIIMASMPAQQSGMASALAAKARSIGMVVGMLVTAGMLAVDFGDDAVALHPERLVGTVTAVFGVLVVTAAAALAVAVVPGWRRRGHAGASTP